MRMFKKMQQGNLKLYDSTLATLSVSFSRELQLDLAESLLNQISDCLYPHPYNALLASCDALNQPEWAVRVFAKMRLHSHCSLKNLDANENVDLQWNTSLLLQLTVELTVETRENKKERRTKNAVRKKRSYCKEQKQQKQRNFYRRKQACSPLPTSLIHKHCGFVHCATAKHAASRDTPRQSSFGSAIRELTPPSNESQPFIGDSITVQAAEFLQHTLRSEYPPLRGRNQKMVRKRQSTETLSTHTLCRLIPAGDFFSPAPTFTDEPPLPKPKII
ncbi:unnamed protein product [Vicia faba]|uniref:Pentatricopeptide repeat-containing protein n=1 Tax=Vicia faba TaxID=3906 RepID=A0AAV0YEF0_VICFA|nr:unnamed protein product [Vicia faba]